MVLAPGRASDTWRGVDWVIVVHGFFFIPGMVGIPWKYMVDRCHVGVMNSSAAAAAAPSESQARAGD